MYPMSQVTRAAHAAGATHDLGSGALRGAMPLHVTTTASPRKSPTSPWARASYLNGSWRPVSLAHPRLTARMDHEQWRQPLAGWFGHAAPFDFTPDYQPGTGMSRFLCGTPPVLSLAALNSVSILCWSG